MVISVIMVAEKPSIAKTLAEALCRGGRPSERKGVSLSVYEYEGDFYGQRAWFKVTSVAGHVYEINFPNEMNNWDKVDPLQLYAAKTIKQESNPKLQMPRHLSKEGKGCSYLVLWLDCDREGENICYEVMENIEPVLTNVPGQQQVWRAKFSSLAPVDLKRAMDNLGSPDKDQAMSVDARQEIDLKLGCSFTRFQTKYFQGKYGDLDTKLVSYGPCQTPTLWFCVRRHDEITSFQPEQYYTLDVSIKKQDRDLPLEWQRGQVFDQNIVRTFRDIIEGGSAYVTGISEKEDRMPRPQALNTVAMLKMASTRLGMGPQQAMHQAESLYLRGWLTYPRTETNTYPGAFDLRGTVAQFTNSPSYGGYASEIMSRGLNKARDGVDMGDHPPITPCRSGTESQIGDGWRLYDMVTRHFLATISGDCKFMRTKISIDLNGEEFALKGRKVIDPGFTKIQKEDGGMDDIYVPEFSKGESVAVTKTGIGQHTTRPPPYLSESDLLGLMEKHGIGTDASMATHINNICERKYVELREGRRLAPTKLGISLVHGFQLVDNELVIPRIRGNIESSCNLIANGHAYWQMVVHHVLKIFRDKFMYFVKNVELIDQLFESTFTPLESSGRALSRCGNCKKYLYVVDKRPVRMFCKHCDRIFKMPQNGQIKEYKTLQCPLDDFELVYVANKVGKSYPLCPMCYDDPPFGKASAAGKLWELEHPVHKKYRPAVMSCIADDCEGTLCLDVDSHPKWQIDCNMAWCPQQIQVFGDKAHKIKVSPDHCEECGAHLLAVTFNKTKSPLDGGETEKTACIACDELFNSLCSSATSKNFVRRGGGGGSKGKGKGKGKKGRGRGKTADELAEERGRALAKKK
eukprot:TRINITY_DN121220_c0_g1_i1.p1 TRINITY_DN121220_c0_g1~~TRINITY_DN121220_c0_g1_i1.p1  ORF type:complete len:858 (+),score=186.81 TRINITY_DN121220_c0_g1_i1:105-2678(+)